MKSKNTSRARDSAPVSPFTLRARYNAPGLHIRRERATALRDPCTMRCVLTANERNRALLDRFWCDQAGSYLIITGLMMPVIVGCVALAADYGLLLHTRQSMQGAADSAAISAAT